MFEQKGQLVTHRNILPFKVSNTNTDDQVPFDALPVIKDDSCFSDDFVLAVGDDVEPRTHFYAYG